MLLKIILRKKYSNEIVGLVKESLKAPFCIYLKSVIKFWVTTILWWELERMHNLVGFVISYLYNFSMG